MHKAIFDEIAKDGRVVLKSVPMPDISKKFRTLDLMRASTMETLWQLISRASEEAAIEKEALWQEVAKELGYSSIEAVHDNNKSLQIDHGNGTVLIVGKPEAI